MSVAEQKYALLSEQQNCRQKKKSFFLIPILVSSITYAWYWKIPQPSPILISNVIPLSWQLTIPLYPYQINSARLNITKSFLAGDNNDGDNITKMLSPIDHAKQKKKKSLSILKEAKNHSGITIYREIDWCPPILHAVFSLRFSWSPMCIVEGFNVLERHIWRVSWINVIRRHFSWKTFGDGHGFGMFTLISVFILF